MEFKAYEANGDMHDLVFVIHLTLLACFISYKK